MDSPLFMLTTKSDVLWTLIYVDDIIITSYSPLQTDKFIRKLNLQFSLKDLEPLTYFLGIEVFRDLIGLHLTRTKYISGLLTHTDMVECKVVPTLASS